jgi:L-2-hydroxyglutarate oxidase
MSKTYDYTIIGGGIVGLATGVALLERFPTASLLLLEKESYWASHQTGHNSGVIHSGIYYKPGSYKARFAIEGSKIVPQFCREHGIAYDVCGKVIVATERHELPQLEKLFKRGQEHGLDVKMLTPEQLREVEPHCNGLAAIKVASTGIADYKAMATQFARIIEARGGDVRLGARVSGIKSAGVDSIVESNAGDFATRFVINCCGLHSDRVARMTKADPTAKIVPFRGEYYELKPERRYLVRNLIYPVPDPNFPFLGVHYTRMTDGNIHCGPNAVLAFKREGYHKTDFSAFDLLETLTYRGFWNLAIPHMKSGLMEMWRSFSKSAFTRSLQRLIPEVQKADLIPSHAGVRAQALTPSGKMVDDFLIVPGHNSMNVCNAPSPAATASIPIGREIASQVPEPTRRPLAMAS